MKRTRSKRRVAQPIPTVLVRCTGCRAEKRIGAGEIAKDDYPICEKDFMPMVPISAAVVR